MSLISRLPLSLERGYYYLRVLLYNFQGHRAVRDGNILPAAGAWCFLGIPEGRYGKKFTVVLRGMGMGREGGKPFG